MEQADRQEITIRQELAYELRVEQAMTRSVITVAPGSTMASLREVLLEK